MHAGLSSSWVSGAALSVGPVKDYGLCNVSGGESACGVAAEERVKHGQLHALLVSSAPRDHGPVTVGRVKVMSVTRERKTERELRACFIWNLFS